jgi:hypothetical protein
MKHSLTHCGNASPLTRRELDELDDDGITDVAIDEALGRWAEERLKAQFCLGRINR